MPTVTPQAGPPSANTVGAGNRTTDMLDSRLEQLEARVMQLQTTITQLQATVTAQAELIRVNNEVFRGHTHNFTYTGVHWYFQPLVREAHATGDTMLDVGVIDRNEDHERTTGPARCQNFSTCPTF